MQLFVPPLNPGYVARAENSFYKFGKKIWVSTMCAQILWFSTVRVRARVRVHIRVSLVKLVCASTLDNNVVLSVESISGLNFIGRSQCHK